MDRVILERQVLGIALRRWERIVPVEVFDDPWVRKVYAAFTAASAVDRATSNLFELAQQAGVAYGDVLQVATNGVGPSDEAELVRSLVAEAQRRGVRARLVEVVRALENGAAMCDVEARVLAAFSSTGHSDSTLQADVFLDAARRIRAEQVDGGGTVSLGIPGMDEYQPPADAFVVVASRPSVGKTMMALQMFAACAERGATPLFISLEMTRVSLLRRMVAAELGLDIEGMRRRGHMTAEQLYEVDRCLMRMRGQRMHLVEGIHAPSQILRTISDYCRADGTIRVCFVDHLAMVSWETRDRLDQEIGRFTRALARSSKRHGVCIVLLHQLSRGYSNRKQAERMQHRRSDEPVEPSMEDLRDSGGIEQDADVIWALDRPHKGHDGDTILMVYVLKNRDGRLGRVQLYVTPSNGRIMA